jgi:hypothetical protein
MARKDWTNSQHGEYQRLMMIADTVRDDVASDYSRRSESTETIGGMRISEKTTSKALKMHHELHLMKAKDTQECAVVQAICDVNIWAGDNDPHWIKVRNRGLERLNSFGLETEEKIQEWLKMQASTGVRLSMSPPVTSNRDQILPTPHYTQKIYNKAQLVFDDGTEGTSSAYNDRLMQWDSKAYFRADAAAKGSRFPRRSANYFELFLKEYYEKPVTLHKVYTGVNLSNGYEYYVFNYTVGE